MAKLTKQEIINWYTTNQDELISDKDLMQTLRISATYISTVRRKMIQEGHTFGVASSPSHRGNTAFWYAYLGKTGKGFICIDSERSPCHDGLFKSILDNSRSNNIFEIVTLIREQNSNGYFSFESLAGALGWPTKKVQITFYRLCQHQKLDVHAIGLKGDRKYRVVGKIAQLNHDVTVEDNSINGLLNQVFR